ncbi:MAG: chemotaxis protein CheD [Azospirillaceae bacterium]|nr:chemotaxis protein CheD [Azospirillaceae bacterium]
MRPESIFCSSTPTVVTTVLGSCVSICLWDRVLRVGGINHFLLPQTLQEGSPLRYGESSCDQLVRDMVALGCRVDSLEAKVFGGAAVLFGLTPETSVGTRNVEIALARLQFHRIPVRARRTGGERGLWVQLITDSFDVLVRPVQTQVQPPAIL